MSESPGRLTVLQLTHQGEGAGSTQSIFSLSRELARRGHRVLVGCPAGTLLDRKSTRLNSSHLGISYAVFCLKKKNLHLIQDHDDSRRIGLDVDAVQVDDRGA